MIRDAPGRGDAEHVFDSGADFIDELLNRQRFVDVSLRADQGHAVPTLRRHLKS
jgi:hypothetical protein